MEVRINIDDILNTLNEKEKKQRARYERMHNQLIENIKHTLTIDLHLSENNYLVKLVNLLIQALNKELQYIDFQAHKELMLQEIDKIDEFVKNFVKNVWHFEEEKNEINLEKELLKAKQEVNEVNKTQGEK